MNERPENEGLDVTVVDPAAPGDAPDAPEEVRVSTFRLVATLAVAGALAGLLIVLVNLHTKPIIDEYRAEPEVYEGLALPDWVYEMPDAWLVIPLAIGAVGQAGQALPLRLAGESAAHAEAAADVPADRRGEASPDHRLSGWRGGRARADKGC